MLGRVLVGLAVTVAISVLGVARPWPTKILVDNVFARQPLAGLGQSGALGVAIGLTVGLFAAAGLLGLLQKRVLWGLSQRLTSDLRGHLFGHLTRLDLRFHDDRPMGDVIHRVVNDTYSVQTVLLNGIVPLLSNALTIVLTLVVMVRLDVELAALTLVSLPPAALLARRFGGRIRDSWTDYREREADIMSHTEQTLSGIRVVKAFARESYELGRFQTRTESSLQALMRVITLQMVFGLLVDLVLALGLAAVTYAAAQHAISGQITPGEALVFLAYAAALYTPFTELASTFSELQSSAASAQRVFEILDEPQPADHGTVRPPSARAAGALRFEGVDFAYRPGQPVVHDIRFELAPGRLVAVVGPTGAGKSTLVALAMRMYDPAAGRITLDGLDLRDLPLTWVREQIAYVPQDPILFPVSVRENIRYGRLDATDDEINACARQANIFDELSEDPRGLDTPIGEGGVTLSGGQRQRVAIARALLRDAPLLILDEPTSALDANTEALVMGAVARLVQGRATMVVAHRLATVERADCVLVVAGGRITDSGVHADLLERSALYADLHAARFSSGRILPLPRAPREPLVPVVGAGMPRS